MTDDTDAARLDTRLDRLEQKLDASVAGMHTRLETKLDHSVAGIHERLDKLTEALATIRLLEERVGQNSRSLERAFAKLEAHDQQIDQIKQTQAGTAVRLGTGERLTWIIVTAAVGAITYALRGTGA